MYHSITFGEKNTWDDWHLIPSSRPVFSPPQPNIRLLNIPGRSGSLDITDAYGQVVYADRTGSFEFYVDHETEPTMDEQNAGREFISWGSWKDAYQSIMSYLHGQRMKAVLEDDPNYYYEGRFSVSDWRSNANYSTITINYVVQPYKFMQYEYGCDWLWDPVDFTDSIRTRLNRTQHIPISMSGSSGERLEIVGSGYRSIPVIECSQSGVEFYFDDVGPITLSEGQNRPSIAVVTTGRHILRFVGDGYVNVHYRSGSL